ncbi:hypothetical protein HN51_069399 [Arachis hypogaea]
MALDSDDVYGTTRDNSDGELTARSGSEDDTVAKEKVEDEDLLDREPTPKLRCWFTDAAVVGRAAARKNATNDDVVASSVGDDAAVKGRQRAFATLVDGAMVANADLRARVAMIRRPPPKPPHLNSQAAVMGGMAASGSWFLAVRRVSLWPEEKLNATPCWMIGDKRQNTKGGGGLNSRVQKLGKN